MSNQKKPKKDSVEKLQQEIKQDTSDELEKLENGEVVSSKKVIYTEIDDEVGAIYSKIKAIQGKHIYLVVPKKAALFQSVVNLKIIKRKAKDEEKTIYLITSDKNGIYLANQVGITVYDKVTEGKPSLFSTEINDEKLRITPLKASINSIDIEPPTRLKEKKVSISEILKKAKGLKTLNISRITQNQPVKKEEKKSKFFIVSPNRHALIGLVVASIFILLVIVYIALPGATIYLTPTASVLEKSVNITLADYQKNKAELDTKPTHMIASFDISAKISKTITQASTGKKISERGANSGGKITIINTTTDSWPLIAKTRFQTNDGIVFRIAAGITVPPATSAGPGKIEAYVSADPVDANGGLVGELGNIGPSKFFLPGLKEASRSKIYAESSSPMTGGITDFISYIQKEDLDAANAKLKDELMKEAVVELNKAVAQKNTLVGDSAQYKLLEGTGAIKISDIRSSIPGDLPNKEAKDFTISGEVDVSGVYYDNAAMTGILKSELMLKKSPQKELLRINEDSVSYRIFEWDANTGKIKMTANIKGIEQYSINPDDENGRSLLTKIRSHVAGKNIQEAKDYIQNLPEINKVEIDSWPAWSPTIPSIADNIKFKIQSNIVPNGN